MPGELGMMMVLYSYPHKVFKLFFHSKLLQYSMEAQTYMSGHRYLVLVLVPSGMGTKGIRSILIGTKAARFEEFYSEPPTCFNSGYVYTVDLVLDYSSSLYTLVVYTEAHGVQTRYSNYSFILYSRSICGSAILHGWASVPSLGTCTFGCECQGYPEYLHRYDGC